MVLALMPMARAEDLVIELAPGQTWRVAQTVTFSSSAKPVNATKPAPGGMPTPIREPYTLVESYVDECVPGKAAGSTELRRKFLSSRLSTRNGKGPAPTALEGAVLLFTLGQGTCSAIAERGAPEPGSLALLRRAPHIAEQALLPAGAVSVRDAWVPDPSSVAHDLGLALSYGVASALKPARDDVAYVLYELVTSPGEPSATAGRCHVRATLESVSKGVATIRFDDAEFDTSGTLGKPPNAPDITSSVSGLLTLRIVDKRPLRFEWKVSATVSFKKSGAQPGYGGNVEWTEQLSVVRTYK